MKGFWGILAVACLLACSGPALAAGKMTNKDVIALVHAHLSQDAIVAAIGNSKTAFDTSTDGLIALNKAGVPDTVIQAMIGAGTAPHAAAPAAAHAAVTSPDSITIVADGKSTPMHYFTPEMRTAARALGFGGIAQYAVLKGTAAMLRIKDRQPVFMIAIPDNAQPQNYFTLANFEVRKNGSREVSTGGGYLSYSTGIVKDRIVATNCEKAASQAHAPAGFTVYKVAPVAPMKSGEYALVVNSSQVHVAGFASGLDSYFDFGID